MRNLTKIIFLTTTSLIIFAPSSPTLVTAQENIAPIYANHINSTVIKNTINMNTNRNQKFAPQSINCGPINGINSAVVSVESNRGNEIYPMCGTGDYLYIAGFRVTGHAAKQMAEREISTSRVAATLTNGKKYYDPKEANYPYYKNGLVVATSGKNIITVYKSNGVPSRFKVTPL